MRKVFQQRTLGNSRYPWYQSCYSRASEKRQFKELQAVTLDSYFTCSTKCAAPALKILCRTAHLWQFMTCCCIFVKIWSVSWASVPIYVVMYMCTEFCTTPSNLTRCAQCSCTFVTVCAEHLHVFVPRCCSFVQYSCIFEPFCTAVRCEAHWCSINGKHKINVMRWLTLHSMNFTFYIKHDIQ